LTAGDNTLFVPAAAGAALGTTSTGFGATASSTLSDVTANPGTLSGDVAGSYYTVPAGTSRMFTYNGSLDNTNGTSGLKTFKVTSINYGTTPGVYTSAINYNLDSLKVSPTL
jgi:hypothetical protein